VDLHGHSKEVSGSHLHFVNDFVNEVPRKENREFWQSYADEQAGKMAKSPSVRDRSNYAGALLHLREYEKARDILLEAERLSPGDYAVAANLGTAFELLGDNENALKWIKIGLLRNSDSHHGTEWVHVKILEAKIAVAKDPTWLKHHSVVGADFGTEAIPQFTTPKSDNSDERETPEALIKSISYQLKERIEFVSAPDPYVGDLLFDLANALAVSENVNYAVDIYALARSFEAPKAELVSKRLSLALNLVKTANRRKIRNQILLGALGVATIGIPLYIWIRFRRKQRLVLNSTSFEGG
jgi:tetratricopeptide (TPR) repeat protein